VAISSGNPMRFHGILSVNGFMIASCSSGVLPTMLAPGVLMAPGAMALTLIL